MCVYRTAFLSIFGVSSGRLNRALKTQAMVGGTPHTDRHRHHLPVNKTSSEKLKFVGDHMKSFPKYESHY